MNNTENKTKLSDFDFDFVLDTTVEAPLTDLQKFENFQRKLAADRAAVAARFAKKSTDTESFLRVARSL